MFKINLQLSIHISNKYGQLFQKKGCYQNVFKLLTDVKEIQNKKETKVLYCYAYNNEFYYRHAFCLYHNEIIEPLKNIIKGLNNSMIIPFAELPLKAYYSLICKDQKYDLYDSLYLQEIKALNDNKHLMPTLNPIDMSSIVSRVAKSANEHLCLLNDILCGKGISIER